MTDLVSLSCQPSETRFDLALDEAAVLRNLDVVRRVPNKRLVCRGQWNGQPVYAKIFIGPQARRYAARDAAGVERLVNAGIATPALLHSGLLADKGGTNSGSVLIFAAIADGMNAEESWQQAAGPERLELATRLVEAIAQHHNAGLMQTDLYLKNFLVAGDRIYTLDGDAIKPFPRFSPNQAALGNLAILLSKFDVLEIQAWLEPLLQAYAAGRGWREQMDVPQMQTRITQHRRRVVQGYAEKKVLRQCTDVAVSRSWHHFLALSRKGHSAELEQVLLNTPDALLDGVGQKRLKSGNTCTVGLTEINDRKMVVKRYNIKSFWHGVGRSWRPSRAALSWKNAHRLMMYGIGTANPLALLESRFGPLRGRAYFLAEYIQAPNIAQLMEDASVTQERKQQVAENLAWLMYKLMLLQIAHGDLKASNIHIEGARPLLIDLDSLREYRYRLCFASRHVSDLRRLLKNWQDQPQIYRLLVEALQRVYGRHRLLAKALGR
ncbi:hypothetical protein MTYP_00537 [Methylophilaceae bacterium]|nr:hypothetical protein MTYP_00537 [Methylophilaceae bacterium]